MAKASKISVSLYPDGKDFAFSVIDDTDYSTGPDIEPVYDLLYNLGIRTTKTVWISDQKHSNSFKQKEELDIDPVSWGHSLDNDQYLRFVLALNEKGFEIALHGVTAGNDYRNEIIEGYEKFYRIFGRYPEMEILHAQNIENIYAGSYKLDNLLLRWLERLIDNSDYQGHIPGSEYFWGDICKKYIKYVRLPFHTIKEINLFNICSIFPFHDPRRPFVNFWFPNSDGSNFKAFMALTSRANIDKLIRQRGTTLIYTHFANQFTHKTNGKYILKPEFIERMEHISKLNGYFATVTEILDRFLNLRNVFVESFQKKVVIVNAGSETIKGVTIICGNNIALYKSETEVYKPDDRGKIIIGDLPGYSNIVLYKELPVTINRYINRVNVSILEHMKIEAMNYIGMIFKRK